MGGHGAGNPRDDEYHHRENQRAGIRFRVYELFKCYPIRVYIESPLIAVCTKSDAIRLYTLKTIPTHHPFTKGLIALRFLPILDFSPVHLPVKVADLFLGKEDILETEDLKSAGLSEQSIHQQKR